MANGKREINFIFTDFKNQNLIRNDIYQRSKRNAVACELPNIGCHGFRHTFASLMYDSGSDSKEVQEILGHTDIAVTMNTYTHASEKRLSTAIERHAQYMNF